MAIEHNTRVRVPAQVRRGEVFAVRCLVMHPMENGRRADAEGRFVPMDLIHRFVCRYGGQTVFQADMGTGNRVWTVTATITGVCTTLGNGTGPLAVGQVGSYRRAWTQKRVTNDAGTALVGAVATPIADVADAGFAGAAITITTHDETNVLGARIVINNNQLSDPPPDVAYVDVIGYAGVTKPGDIAQNVLVGFGGVLLTDLVISSFRLLDRDWRWNCDGLSR